MTQTAELTERDEVIQEMAAYLRDTSSVADPYPMFKRVRELAPIHYSPVDAWIVTSYPLTVACLRSAVLLRGPGQRRDFAPLRRDDDPPEVSEALDMALTGVLNSDHDEHTRLRRLLNHGFVPRAVARWREEMTERVKVRLRECLDMGTFDLLADLTYPETEATICSLMGVPFSDREVWLPWTELINEYNRTTGDSSGTQNALVQATVGFFGYFKEKIAERRGRAEVADDFLSQLVAAEEQGDRLTEHEIISTGMVAITAGHNTTAQLSGTGLLALIRHPDQYDLFLRSDEPIVKPTVEEFIRFDTTARGNLRVCVEDVEIGGELIREGDRVGVNVNAANHDPEVFADADRLDIMRDPNPHVGFGAGEHFCLGAQLARMEANVIFNELRQGPRLELAIPYEDVKWRPTWGRAIRALPVKVAE